MTVALLFYFTNSLNEKAASLRAGPHGRCCCVLSVRHLTHQRGFTKKNNNKINTHKKNLSEMLSPVRILRVEDVLDLVSLIVSLQ